MEPIRVAVCEDDKAEQDKLLDILAGSSIGCRTELFSCGEALLRDFRAGKYDLILMDIYMGGMTGIEAIRRLREMDAGVPVAFITTSTEHALESYRLEALKYIEKPVKEKAVADLLQMALLRRENAPRLRLRSGGRQVSVPFDRIVYVEQRDHTLYVFLTGDEVLTVGERLDSIQGQFAEQSFFRCHKSYLVNLAYVRALDRELMIFSMKEGGNVHIRRASLSTARKAFETYLYDAARRNGDE